MMNIIYILKKIRHLFSMIPESNRLIHQIRFNQKKYILEQNILHSQESGVTNEKYCGHDIIVSLTTYSKTDLRCTPNHRVHHGTDHESQPDYFVAGL